MASVQYEPGLPENGHYRFKILVPSVAAGAIIGKGGETIAQLQKDTGTRIIMSKVRDFYPGTNERVCLISGRVEGILSCLEVIMEKFKERPEFIAKSGAERKISVERERQVKILVPNSTASMIIGERGTYIKQVKKDSGAMVQISQKCSDPAVSPSMLIERCITVTGDLESNAKACKMILEKIVEDPHSGICSNVSYVEFTGPVANSDPMGSPFANSDVNSSGSMKSAYSNSSNSSVCNVSQKPVSQGEVVPPISNNPMLGSNSIFVENVTRILRINGYVEQAVSDITVALTTLESLGVLNFILVALNNYAASCSSYGFQQVPFPVSESAMSDVPVAASGVANLEHGFDPIVTNGSHLDQTSTLQRFPESRTLQHFPESRTLQSFPESRTLHTFPESRPLQPFPESRNLQPFPESRYHHMFLTESEAAAFDPLYSSPTVASPIAASLPIRENSVHTEWSAQYQTPFDTQLPSNNNETMMGDTAQIDIEVPESIVGAILGQGGKVLVEIQQLSGANVQISKKGIFVPGTLNRIVSITGSPNAVCTAQSLIEQRITEAKLKRGQQSAFESRLLYM